MKTTIFIDESGTLPDVKDRVIIVAAVGAVDLQRLDLVFRSIQKKRISKEKPLELKFYKTGVKTKNLFFEKLSELKVDIFILIVEKMGRKIPDTPSHFATLCGILISEIIHFYPEIQKVVFDRHFHRVKDQDEFNKVLVDFLNGKDLNLQHVDSKQNPAVNIADMVAGAVLSKETGRESSFYETIKDKVVSEIKLNWPEAKRRLLDNKKLV